MNIKFIFPSIIALLFITGCNSNLDSAYTSDESIISPCSVPQVPLDIENEVLVLVENEAELNRIFACHTKELPQINFRKSKLLLIHGSHIKQVKEITLDSFERADTDKGFYLHVTVKTKDIDKDCSWTAAYLVPRSFDTPICLFLTISDSYQVLPGYWLYFK